MPPNVGLFPYAIDIQTFKALEFVLKKQWNCDFYIDSETQEIYLPENIDPTDVRDELRLSGFYMKITNAPQYNKKPLKVRIIGEICYNPLGTLHEMGKKVLGKHGSYLIIMDNLEKAEIKEQALDIWGEFEVKALMNSILEDAVLDKELSLWDAVRPYLGEVFTLTVKSIGYRKVVVAPGFPGYDDIEEFDEGG